jgi:hypothetical protein
VLGLPASLAWLGWVGGIVALVFFFAVSLWAALMLTEVYMVRAWGLHACCCCCWYCYCCFSIVQGYVIVCWLYVQPGTPRRKPCLKAMSLVALRSMDSHVHIDAYRSPTTSILVPLVKHTHPTFVLFSSQVNGRRHTRYKYAGECNL